MKNHFSLLLGKSIKQAARVRGGGSALPGLVVEKLDPGFLARLLGQLPMGVALITGTNGKTTTTKIVVALLRAQGLRVFTNRSGSNFTRGVVSELLDATKMNGKLPYDIAVLELDEAHATHFAAQVAPLHTLVLNVMRDQLDRFGEIDHTARLLQTVVEATTESVVLNQDDPRVAALANTTKTTSITYFGAADSLQKLFVADDALHSDVKAGAHPTKHPKTSHNDVELVSFAGQQVTFTIDGAQISAELKLSDVYNFLNAAGALALCRAILKNQAKNAVPSNKAATVNPPNTVQLITALAQVEPAFGRGETFTINDQELEITLVKNPGGFRLALSSFNHPDTAVMIAINDNYADGRDMSWLWDVDFSSLQNQGVRSTSGVRAFDMALRLQYDDITPDSVQPNITQAVAGLIKDTPNQPKRIFCTYTAMLAIRRELKKYTAVEQIL